MSKKHLFTFGYEGVDINTFIERLRHAGVQTVVDVRELPLSRKKGFSKTALRENLANKNIGYIHVPELGCPKPIRNRYKENGDWAAYTKSFLAYIKTQDATVRQLAKLANTTTICLICYEADFSMCHRTYVARAAHLVGGPPVKHITATVMVVDLPDLRVA